MTSDIPLSLLTNEDFSVLFKDGYETDGNDIKHANIALKSSNHSFITNPVILVHSIVSFSTAVSR